ncbi:hypothetical protein [Streptomyces sp. NPDC002104]
MLIELIEVGPQGSPPVPVAHVRTPLGEVSAVWCGDPSAEPGRYRVEWTVDEELTWGENTWPAEPESGPGIHQDAQGAITLRGRLDAEEDGVFVLRLGADLLLLEAAVPLPGPAVARWVQLRCPREAVSLHPYGL